MSWIQLVEDTLSERRYTRERTLKKHKFRIKNADNKPFALLRIDVSDRIYLDSLDLIYLDEEGEKSLGEGMGLVRNITKHFLFLSPRSGVFKIQTKGAQYKYSIWALPSECAFPPLIYRILSPFDVLIGYEKHIELLDKRIMYREEGSEQFMTVMDLSGYQMGRVGGLDGTKNYEFKVQLFIPNLYETPESDTIKISNISSMIEKYQPDEFLLNSMLKFVAEDERPETCKITLQVRFPFQEWIQFSPSALRTYDELVAGQNVEDESDDESVYGERSQLIFRMEDKLYDKLKEDAVVEWQLIFEEKSTRNTIGGPIVSTLLKKRPKGYKYLRKSRHYVLDTNNAIMQIFHLGKNGQFHFGDPRKNGIRGIWTIDSAKDDELEMTIIPKTNNNEPIYNLKFSRSTATHELFSIKDITDIILDYFIITQDAELCLKDIVCINLVSKDWYQSVRRVLKIRATLQQEQQQLVIDHWLLELYNRSDIKLFVRDDYGMHDYKK